MYWCKHKQKSKTMTLFQIISVIMGILIIAISVVCLINAKNRFGISLICTLFVAVPVFSLLYPTWWTVAISIYASIILGLICLDVIKKRSERNRELFQPEEAMRIALSCLGAYALGILICAVVLATNWCWYVAVTYIAIIIALLILAFYALIASFALAAGMATRS